MNVFCMETKLVCFSFLFLLFLRLICRYSVWQYLLHGKYERILCVFRAVGVYVYACAFIRSRKIWRDRDEFSSLRA